MTLSGTDPVTNIPGLGPSTADGLPSHVELVRDFVIHCHVDRLASKKKLAAREIRTADIDPFDEYTVRDIQLAKFHCAHRARYFNADGQKIPSLDDAVAANPYPAWGFLGRHSLLEFPASFPATAAEPDAIEPAHYRTPGDRYTAVYLITDTPDIDDPNDHVSSPRAETTDTVVLAHEFHRIADLFGRSPTELVDTMRYEQDSPLYFRDPETGLDALLPTVRADARMERATDWPQSTRENADHTAFTLG